MQEDKHRQLHVNFELTNNIRSVERVIGNIPEERSLVLHQVISLLGYKYL